MLLDTNVILDVALRRPGLFDGSKRALEKCEAESHEISTVAPVGHADALRAVGFGLNDFEDALQLSAAESCRADVILTRNKADFGNPPNIAVLAPDEFATAPPAGAQQ